MVAHNPTNPSLEERLLKMESVHDKMIDTTTKLYENLQEQINILRRQNDALRSAIEQIFTFLTPNPHKDTQ